MIAKMRNIGEACTAANRFHVHESVAERVRRAAGRAHGRAEGRAAGPRTASRSGPLIDDSQREKVDELVEDAVQRGARVLTAARRSAERGYFYAPTVLADVPDDARAAAARRSSARWRRSTTVLHRARRRSPRANDTEYGLVAYMSTPTTSSARCASAEALETGMVGLNQGMVSNAGRALRRRQAVGLRPRGRLRGHRRVPGDEVRGDRPVGGRP